MRRNVLAAILTLCVLFSSAGCAGGGSGTSAAPEGQSSQDSQTASVAEGQNTPEASDAEYPLSGGELTYWKDMPKVLVGVVTDYNEIEWVKEREKRTGVKVTYITPPVGQEDEKFNLMIASNDLPDIIERKWREFPGGPEKAIQQGVIIELNDVFEQYAPSLKHILAENPEEDKEIKTDRGVYYMFPFLGIDDYVQTYRGPQIRGDWLEELGLEVPETIDDWTTVLTAFKEEKGATAPLTFRDYTKQDSMLVSTWSFISAYNTTRDFFQVDGAVKFGPLEPGYKDYLTLFNQWYKNGLLDPDYSAQDNSTMIAKITSGKSGASIDSSGGNMALVLSTIKQEDPDATYVAAPYPVLNRGDTPNFGQKEFASSPGGSAAITTACKDVETAARWLDYGYSEEGHMLENFGIEGVTYNMVDGYPQYSELLTANPDFTLPQMLAQYARSCYNGPIVQDPRYLEQYLAYDEQKSAIPVWTPHDSSKRMPLVTPTPEESSEFASIMNEIETYVKEMEMRFIMGQESLDNYEAFQEQLKKMNIDRALEIQQMALERYNQR